MSRMKEIEKWFYKNYESKPFNPARVVVLRGGRHTDVEALKLFKEYRNIQENMYCGWI